ncbi:MAG: MarR family transcriptional regulator [Desulfobacterales bacterium]|nr:MarR family transcriptional regulator [Desulfobacterales bacterium]
MSVSDLSHKFMEFYDKLSSWEHSVVKESGLSPAQMHTIEVIGHHQNLMMRELADRLGITTGTLTVAVDRLEKLGMVMRKPHEHDRRAWLVVLTKQGKKMYEQHNKYHEEFTQEISHDLTNKEIKTLFQLMDRILQRM